MTSSNSALTWLKVKEPLRDEVITVEEVKTLMTKEGLPTHVSIEEALRLPKEMWKALIVVLANPNDHGVQRNKDEGSRVRSYEYATCYAA